MENTNLISRKFKFYILVILALSISACSDSNPESEPIESFGTITINPTTDNQDSNGDIANATWELIGPDGYNLEGSGETVLDQLNVGSYRINWGNVSNWVTPTSFEQELTLNDNLEFNGKYYGNTSSANAYLKGLIYANLEWNCSEANQTASCSSSYHSMIPIGEQKGVAYDWGGYDLVWAFIYKISRGLGAGNVASDDILDCTAGVDASGFISQVWGLQHFTTSSFFQIMHEISPEEVTVGDIWVYVGYDAVMQGPEAGVGKVRILHASQEKMKVCEEIVDESYLKEYTPMRLNDWDKEVDYSDSSYDVLINEQLKIFLDIPLGNEYFWYVDYSNNPSIVEFINKEFAKADEINIDGIGQEVWTYKGLQKGNALFYFKNRIDLTIEKQIVISVKQE